LNGSLEHCGHQYPAWSTLFIEPGDAPPLVSAGEQGLGVAILQFSAQDRPLRH